VYVIANGQVVDGFMGAQPENVIREFVAKLLPSEASQTVRRLIDAGDEESLRVALSVEPGNAEAVVAMARLLVKTERSEEALQVLARIPETDEVRQIAAAARLAADPVDDFDAQLVQLLDVVKTDEVARQKYLDILETMGPDDPRTARYRKQLTARLF
jgi:putative thioredoxin